MNMKYWQYWKWALVWVISLKIFIIVSAIFLNLVQFTSEFILAGMGYSLIVTAMVFATTKNKLHFGHLPTIIGANMMILGIGLLFGGSTIPIINKIPWWSIDSITVKTILGVLAIIGFLVFAFGTKETAKQWWWLRPFGTRRLS